MPADNLNDTQRRFVEKYVTRVSASNEGSAPNQAEGNIGGVSLTKLGIARAQWPAARNGAHEAIRTVQSRMRAAYAPYPSEASKVEAAIGKIERVVTTLDDTLKSQLDDVYNAQDDEARTKTVGVVQKTVAKFKNFVETDPIAKAIDGNSFAPGTSAIGPVKKNLDDMIAALGK